MGFPREKIMDLCNIFTSKPEDFEDVQLILKEVNDFFIKHAHYLNLGRLSLTYNVPLNIFSIENHQGEIDIYNARSYTEANVFECKYVYLKQDLVFHAYPIDEFSEENKEDINFIISVIFTYYTRFKSINYINNAKYYDNITGYYNGPGMFKKMKQKGTNISEYACLFVNLKNFKLVNKKMGMHNGNIIIKQYAKNVMHKLLKDEYIGRLGGDNFLMFVKKERLQLILVYLDFLCVTAEIDGKIIKMDVPSRIGIYEVQGDEEKYSEILGKANIACLTCKGLKETNSFYYTEDFAAKLSIEQQVLMSFNKSIANEEFEVFYQPKVDVKTNKLCGAEALVRWKKENNYISPSNFTYVLERENLIPALDMYMLEHVCKDLRNFLDEGMEPVKISINFSRTNLKNEYLYDKIIAKLDKYDIDPKYIEIEITECSMLEDQITLRPFIEKLNRKGINVSVDDFGTGYSSLNFIKDYNFDAIKIDKSFIDAIDTNNEKNLLFLKNILNLIKDLDMKIVAEGVENEMQLEYLKSIGCDIIQGFIFDRPLKKEKFIERIKNKFY